VVLDHYLTKSHFVKLEEAIASYPPEILESSMKRKSLLEQKAKNERPASEDDNSLLSWIGVDFAS